MPEDNVSERELTPEEKEFFEAGLEMGLEDRYALLGRTFPVVTPDGRLLTLTRAEAASRGRQMFDSVQARLRQRICTEWDYCKKRNNPRFQNRWNLIQALLQLVTAVLGDVGATAVVLILLGIGLDKFCGCK